jgi:hypothetical protein
MVIVGSPASSSASSGGVDAVFNASPAARVPDPAGDAALAASALVAARVVEVVVDPLAMVDQASIVIISPLVGDMLAHSVWRPVGPNQLPSRLVVHRPALPAMALQEGQVLNDL